MVLSFGLAAISLKSFGAIIRKGSITMNGTLRVLGSIGQFGTTPLALSRSPSKWCSRNQWLSLRQSDAVTCAGSLYLRGALNRCGSLTLNWYSLRFWIDPRLWYTPQKHLSRSGILVLLPDMTRSPKLVLLSRHVWWYGALLKDWFLFTHSCGTLTAIGSLAIVGALQIVD